MDSGRELVPADRNGSPPGRLLGLGPRALPKPLTALVLLTERRAKVAGELVCGYGLLMPRYVALFAAVLMLVACKEIYDGPRVVYYSDTNFYVRHFPWTYSDADVAALAEELCGREGGDAELEIDQQYYPFDLRYATYNCVGVEGKPLPRETDVPPDVQWRK